ncbi:hypothetical protein BJ878DRAFT_557896 [Calycina marina]|uniref:Peptidase A1 domain-containing protein n=1 Tax=Calycina marina TaxID=1763456 RepID=A0A9P8CC23_9HELO|nr:hypothetical protein BJ878DRAFT_557896 [Calycina marina]
MGYADGSQVCGDFFTDELSFGSNSLTGFLMRLATTGNECSLQGLMGVGLKIPSYQSIIESMKSSPGFQLYLDFKYLTPQVTFDFGFAHGGLTIKVPAKELVETLATKPDDLFNNSIDTPCQFILHSSQDRVILCDAFLRSVYVVYDLMSHLNGLATINFNSTTSNVVELSLHRNRYLWLSTCLARYRRLIPEQR